MCFFLLILIFQNLELNWYIFIILSLCHELLTQKCIFLLSVVVNVASCPSSSLGLRAGPAVHPDGCAEVWDGLVGSKNLAAVTDVPLTLSAVHSYMLAEVGLGS